MAIHEYHCANCNTRFEIFQKFSENSGECPKCALPARRIISPVFVNWANWREEKRALIADALGDDVPPSRIPDRAFREI